jgi:hypothetical protein
MKRNRGTPADTGMVRSYVAIVLLVVALQASNAAAFEMGGHVKSLASVVSIPGDSLLQDFSDDPARDINLDVRLNLSGNSGAWSWRSDYQLLAQQGDRLKLVQQHPNLGFIDNALTDDDRRVFDLSKRISDQDDRVITQRLDRLYLTHTSDKTVLKIGRQAVSWGNGIIYNPVDFLKTKDTPPKDTQKKNPDHKR